MKVSQKQVSAKKLSSLKNHIFTIILVLFVVFLMLIIYMANSGSGPYYFSFLKHVPGGDKTGHFILMGTFCFLANSAIGKKYFNFFLFSILQGTSIVFLIVLLEECSQHFIKSRTFDLHDLAADIFGILIFDLFFRFLNKKTKEIF